MTEYYICKRDAISLLNNKRYTFVFYNPSDNEIGFKFGDKSSALALTKDLTDEELTYLTLKGCFVTKVSPDMFTTYLKAIIEMDSLNMFEHYWYNTNDTFQL